MATPQTTSQSQSQSQSQSASGSQSRSSSSSYAPIPQTAPAGLLTVTQPPQTAVSFYKVAQGQFITFGWNFSYVLATPTSLTVSAVADNGNTYPVGPTDGIIPGTATQVVWDPYSYDQANPNTPLAQASYTLHIWDDRGPDATRQPGYLQPNSALKFALYTPQPYTPIASGWTCGVCNGSLSNYTEHPAFPAILAALFVMFLSGFNLIRHAPGFR
jgi:hypothetical protein